MKNYIKSILIWAGLSPVFLVLAFAVEEKALQDIYVTKNEWMYFCLFMLIVPNIIISTRIITSIMKGISKNYNFEIIDSARDGVLSYSFSMMTPFLVFGIDSGEYVLLYLFVVFVMFRIFYIYNIVHFNIIFALFGIRVFLCRSSLDSEERVVLSRENTLPKGVVKSYNHIIKGVLYYSVGGENGQSVRRGKG